MYKNGDLGSKCSKTNIRFKISTFQIGHRKNFVKIKKLILFDPNSPNLEMWTQKFQKPMSDLKAALSIQGTWEISLRLESYYFLAPNTQIWRFGLEISKMK